MTLAPSNYPISVKDVIPSGDLPVVGTNTKYRMIYMNMGHGRAGEKIYSDPEQALRQRDSLAWHKEVVSPRRKGGSHVKMSRAILLVFCFALAGNCYAQTAAPPMRHLLVLAEEKGYRHEAVSHAAATIERLGRETDLWITTIRTDTEALTKQKLEYNAKNLNDFDAVLFYTGGDLEMNTEQKAALLSFVHDDGKGFVGVHSATITFTSWPEYGEMIGGYFDEHPWGTFDAPILVEDPNFPGMQQFPKSVILKDEIYQIKDFSRDRVRVLMRLDASKLDLNNPRVHRKDLDFAVTWAKMYGKGRVFYSALGHVEQNWDDPRIQKMYVEAIKWAMGLANADVTPRPAQAQSAALPAYVASK